MYTGVGGWVEVYVVVYRCGSGIQKGRMVS